MADERRRIAEQQLIGAALGMSVLGKVAFAATFAAFLTRAFDQIRMPTSGTPAELLSAAGIDAEHIAQAVRECLNEPPHRASKEGRT